MEPSATAMDEEKYYVNIRDHNKELPFNLRRNRDHSNILEIDSLRDFIKNLIQGEKTLTDNVSTTKPPLKSGDTELRFRLHSPVALHLYDSEGNHTGLIPNPDPASETRFYEARIPNSYYLEFDDTKYAGADTFATTTIVLRGEALGTFNFDIDETLGDQLTATTTFSDIPVTASTTATLSLSSIASMTSLIMDVDGD